MKKLLLFLFPFFALSLQAQNTEVGAFEFDGLLRDYFVYLPSGYTEGEVLPLVFNFHGITSTAGEQYAYTGLFGSMNVVADTGKFIVCYPNGTKIPNGINNEWNVGFSFSSSTADDVGFINALIDTLHAHYQIDLNRVYAAGLSNGGYFAYRLACELTNRFQAVASVAGTFVPGMVGQCHPANSIPVLQIHGTNDSIVLYNGFEHGIPIEQLIQKWLNLDYCTQDVEVFDFPDINTTDSSTAQKFTYANCHSNRQVVFYEINNGDHTWPGSVLDIGITNQDINASREIWEFFLQYTQPIAVSTKDVALQKNKIEAYPNPFGDFVQIQSESPMVALNVFNSMGQEIFRTENIHASNYELPSNIWSKGLYWVQVKNDIGSKTLKIIKD